MNMDITEEKSNNIEVKEEKVFTFSSYDEIVFEHKRLKNAPVMHDLTIKANIFLLIASFVFEIYALISLFGLKDVHDDGMFMEISKYCSIILTMAVINTTFGFFLGSMTRHNRLKDTRENNKKFSKVYILLMIVEFIMLLVIIIIGIKFMDPFIVFTSFIPTFVCVLLGSIIARSIKPQDF